jgi:hypothetical protein
LGRDYFLRTILSSLKNVKQATKQPPTSNDIAITAYGS